MDAAHALHFDKKRHKATELKKHMSKNICLLTLNI
jgi:hypothetical protein